MLVKRLCEYCKKEFFVKPIALKRNRGKFCSKKCLYAYKTTVTGKNNPLWKRIEFTCPVCKKVFYRKQSEVLRGCGIYCSMKCRKLDRIKLICEICGKSFYKLQSEIIIDGYGRFCSKSCYFEYRKQLTGVKNPHWKGGHISYYGPNWREQRRKARKRDDYTCQICNVTEKQLDRELDVHHIQPFRTFNGNWQEANKLSNLISLCIFCHKKTEP